jgi:hypothetical protein
MPQDEQELLPDASRTIEGLRDTGYDFRTAIADVIDNSIAAAATKIMVQVGAALDGELEVSIADNGTGMDESGLLNAMKYGSQVRQSAASLGKFGLGLKTASTAICRQLTVVTRPPKGATLSAQWDLDYVASKNRWLLRRPEVEASSNDLLKEVAGEGSGTIVIWRKVDRLISDYKYQGAAKKAIDRQVESLREHLALTYQRYLAGLEGRRQIHIRVNGEQVEPWDPFALDIGTELLLEKQVPVVIDNVETTFRLRAYVLPPSGELTDEQKTRARIGADTQGFYVFREDRVISAGNWLTLYRIEPHFSLCRVDFSFDYRLDSALHIDIKKSQIYMLTELQDAVKKLITPARNEAVERYRKNERTKMKVEGPGLHASSNAILTNNAEKLSKSDVEVTGHDQAIITNPKGRVSIEIPTLDASEGGPHVVTVDDIEDGLLWRPGVVGGTKSLLLNAGHPFYQRAYEANKANPVAVQGLNFLLWSLCEAELFAITDMEKDHMKAIRREVSRIVRELAKELPEPALAT